MATITRIFEFDSAHRVMNEKVKCFNLHGHRWKVEATFSYSDMSELGYAIDFKEIKRLVGDFIDTYFDHATILNPMDKDLIKLCEDNGWKMWLMGLGKHLEEDVNPSAENIASELFYIIRTMFYGNPYKISLENIRLYETPNCWVDTSSAIYGGNVVFDTFVEEWTAGKGVFNYDIRKDDANAQEENS